MLIPLPYLLFSKYLSFKLSEILNSQDTKINKVFTYIQDSIKRNKQKSVNLILFSKIKLLQEVNLQLN